MASTRGPSFADPGYTEAESANTTNGGTREGRSAPPGRLDSGSKPWSVAGGSFCLTVATFGLLSSIGLFQTHLQEQQLVGEESTKISWLLSIFGFLTCFVAAPVGVLFDRYGSRILLLAGCTVYLAAFAGLAFASTYSQFMACFAIAGLSAGTHGHVL